MERLSFAIPGLLAEAEAHHDVGWGIFVYLGIILAVVFILLTIATKNLTNRVQKHWLSQMAEQYYLFIENLCVSVIGDHGRKYVPFVGTLWLIIFFCNLLGLVLPHTPSADWSITLGLALVVFCYVQYEGIRANGVFGHIGHFAGPKMAGFLLVITPVIFSIELVSELIKILSLSVRLYGNIFAGHTAKGALDSMIPSFPVLGALIFPLEFLVAIIQAFVFVMLTCLYLSMVTAHGEDHDEGHGHANEHGHEALAGAAG